MISITWGGTHQPWRMSRPRPRTNIAALRVSVSTRNDIIIIIQHVGHGFLVIPLASPPVTLSTELFCLRVRLRTYLVIRHEEPPPPTWPTRTGEWRSISRRNIASLKSKVPVPSDMASSFNRFDENPDATRSCKASAPTFWESSRERSDVRSKVIKVGLEIGMLDVMILYPVGNSSLYGLQHKGSLIEAPIFTAALDFAKGIAEEIEFPHNGAILVGRSTLPRYLTYLSTSC